MGGKKVGWKRAQPASRPALSTVPIVNFEAILGAQDNVCAYAATTVYSQRARRVSIFAGSDDTLTIWVNGKKVHANKVYRAAKPDQDMAECRLKKGANSILVKVCEGGGAWSFCLRLVDEWATPLVKGVRYGSGMEEK